MTLIVFRNWYVYVCSVINKSSNEYEYNLLFCAYGICTDRMLVLKRPISSGGRISNRIQRMSSVVVVDDIYPVVRTGDIHRFGIVAVVYFGVSKRNCPYSFFVLLDI